eukprot:401867_1
MKVILTKPVTDYDWVDYFNYGLNSFQPIHSFQYIHSNTFIPIHSFQYSQNTNLNQHHFPFVSKTVYYKHLPTYYINEKSNITKSTLTQPLIHNNMKKIKTAHLLIYGFIRIGNTMHINYVPSDIIRLISKFYGNVSPNTELLIFHTDKSFRLTDYKSDNEVTYICQTLTETQKKWTLICVAQDVYLPMDIVKKHNNEIQGNCIDITNKFNIIFCVNKMIKIALSESLQLSIVIFNKYSAFSLNLPPLCWQGKAKPRYVYSSKHGLVVFYYCGLSTFSLNEWVWQTTTLRVSVNLFSSCLMIGIDNVFITKTKNRSYIFNLNTLNTLQTRGQKRQMKNPLLCYDGAENVYVFIRSNTRFNCKQYNIIKNRWKSKGFIAMDTEESIKCFWIDVNDSKVLYKCSNLSIEMSNVDTLNWIPLKTLKMRSGDMFKMKNESY